MLRANDLIIVNVNTDGEASTKFYIVTKSEGGNVKVDIYR